MALEGRALASLTILQTIERMAPADGTARRRLPAGPTGGASVARSTQAQAQPTLCACPELQCSGVSRIPSCWRLHFALDGERENGSRVTSLHLQNSARQVSIALEAESAQSWTVVAELAKPEGRQRREFGAKSQELAPREWRAEINLLKSPLSATAQAQRRGSSSSQSKRPRKTRGRRSEVACGQVSSGKLAISSALKSNR